MAGVTRRSMRVPNHLVLVALVSLGGCLWLPSRGELPEPGQPMDPQDRTRGTTTVAPVGVGWKVVTGKREPYYLIAADRTECMVPKERWEKAQLGARQLCNWTRPQG